MTAKVGNAENVVPLRRSKPRTYTSNEKIVERLSEEIFASRLPYKTLAGRCGVGSSTISNLASGRTKWPKPTTLFPLMRELGLSFRIEKV